LLIDAARSFGIERLAQVDLGVRKHRNRPLDELGPMATIVLMTALQRAGVASLPADVVLDRPDLRSAPIHYVERPPLRTVLGNHR